MTDRAANPAHPGPTARFLAPPRERPGPVLKSLPKPPRSTTDAAYAADSVIDTPVAV